MSRVFTGTSNNPAVREIVFGREGGAGWKLDVIGFDPSWSDPYGDAWEESLEQILPYLLRFADENSTWVDRESNERVTIWEVFTHHLHKAGC